MPTRACGCLIPASTIPGPRSSTCRSALLIGVVVAVGGVVASAQASVTNGSFEQPTVAVGSFTTFLGGSASIAGWTVVGDRVTVINSSYTESGVTFNAQEGRQWIDLTGPSSNMASNGVTQDVATTIGQLYRLTFYVGSATNNSTFTASTVDLSIAGGARLSFTNPVAPSNALNWQMFSQDFVATTALTNVTFFNGSASNNNLSGLDNVSIELVPAPGVAGLLGLAGLRAARRRR
jgi:hypothetical protein